MVAAALFPCITSTLFKNIAINKSVLPFKLDSMLEIIQEWKMQWELALQIDTVIPLKKM